MFWQCATGNTGFSITYGVKDNYLNKILTHKRYNIAYTNIILIYGRMQPKYKENSNLKSLKKKAGFTLVELSIVIVIIGLIVAGVVGGQALVK